MASSGSYALRVTAHRGQRVEALARRSARVGLGGALAGADRQAVPCEVPGDAAGPGLTWEPRDRDDPAWWPQGVACVRADEVLLVSWYAKRRWYVHTQGARITVVDRTDPDHPRYRHVLLVTARRRLGVLSLGAVRVHAGGIAVVGDLLYVADTVAGVRVFRLGDVLRLPSSGRERADSRRLGRRLTGGFTAYGYDHVLPQLLRLQVPGRTGARGMRYSFLSVGEVDGRPSLFVGEYRRAGSASRRLARYPLDPATGLPALGADGRCPPAELYDGQPPRMQGVAVHGDTWYVSASAGEGQPGDLHVGAPGRFRRHPQVLPTGPEDLDWSHPGERLWCVTEWPGRRWLFPVDVGRWGGPQG